MIPLALLSANWRAIGAGVLLLALGVQTWRVGELKDDVQACETAAKLQVAQYREAAEKARADHIAQKASREAVQAKISEDTTNDYRTRLDAFLRASTGGMRFTPATDTSGAGKANLPVLPVDPAVFERPGAGAVISRDDARDCGVAVIRLTQAREWALEQHANSNPEAK